MINKKEIELIVNELIELPVFLVDVQIGKSNLIQVFIDSLESLNIKSCSQLSRAIEAKLDREKEDFQLDVSSPGLDKPFKVRHQYEKYLQRKIDLWLEEETLMGVELLEILEDSIKISFVEKKKNVEKEISFDEIVKAKPSISFK